MNVAKQLRKTVAYLLRKRIPEHPLTKSGHFIDEWEFQVDTKNETASELWFYGEGDEAHIPIVKFALPNGKELYRKYFNNVNNAVAPEAKRRDCRKKGKGKHGEITYSWRMIDTIICQCTREFQKNN